MGIPPRPARVSQPHTRAARDRLSEAKASYQAYFQGFQLGQAQCQALRQIAALCLREGITPVWFITPEGPAFRSWYPPGVREQVLAFVEALAASTGTPSIDATSWLQEEEFWDSHHPLPAVTDRYTKRLGREGLLPLLSRNPPRAE